VLKLFVYDQEEVAQICLGTPGVLRTIKWLYERCKVGSKKDEKYKTLYPVATGVELSVEGVKMMKSKDATSKKRMFPVDTHFFSSGPSQDVPHGFVGVQSVKSLPGTGRGIINRAYTCPKANFLWDDEVQFIGTVKDVALEAGFLTFYGLSNNPLKVPDNKAVEICVLLGYVPYWVQKATYDYAKYDKRGLVARNSWPLNLEEISIIPGEGEV
jgi:hypothetical protein